MQKSTFITGALAAAVSMSLTYTVVTAKAPGKNEKGPKLTTQTLEATPEPSATPDPTTKPKIKLKTDATPNLSATPGATPEQTRTLTRSKSGAQFRYSEQTGLVTLTTPSGNTHTLKLPESAIANMFRAGKVNEPEDENDVDDATDSAEATDSADTTESEGKLTESVNAQGEFIMTQTVTQPKKLLGVVPVKVKMNISINTNTGKASVTAQSILAKLFGFLLTD